MKQTGLALFFLALAATAETQALPSMKDITKRCEGVAKSNAFIQQLNALHQKNLRKTKVGSFVVYQFEVTEKSPGGKNELRKETYTERWEVKKLTAGKATFHVTSDVAYPRNEERDLSAPIFGGKVNPKDPMSCFTWSVFAADFRTQKPLTIKGKTVTPVLFREQGNLSNVAPEFTYSAVPLNEVRYLEQVNMADKEVTRLKTVIDFGF